MREMISRNRREAIKDLSKERINEEKDRVGLERDERNGRRHRRGEMEELERTGKEEGERREELMVGD